MHRRKFYLVAALVAGCSDGPPVDNDPIKPGPEFVETAVSSKGMVRFMRDDRLRRSLASALGLENDGFCKEVGSVDCFSAHAIALGGVEAYEANIYEPFEETTLTTPLAVERLALAACSERMRRDEAEETARFFSNGIAVTDGRFKDPSDPKIREGVELLYLQLLKRPPLPEEIAALTQFYRDLEALDPAPAQNFKILSCFAIATSKEGIFY